MKFLRISLVVICISTYTFAFRVRFELQKHERRITHIRIRTNQSCKQIDKNARFQCWNSLSKIDGDDAHDSLGINAPRIIYENDYILVIDKPYGLSHHDTALGNLGNFYEMKNQGRDESSDLDCEMPTQESKNDKVTPGLISTLRMMQIQGMIGYQGRLYGVHRLDRVTSGIVVLAKSSRVAGLLSKGFRSKNGSVVKYYSAISAKKPLKKKQGWIVGHMIRARRGAWKLIRDKEVGSSHPAQTRFFTSGLGKLPTALPGLFQQDSFQYPKTFILLRPITGQTHQLRVASKSVGLPILGDILYGGGMADRTYLHSSAMYLNLKEMNITEGVDEEVVLVSYPPFVNLPIEKEGWLKEIFLDMIEKHCDCEPIKQYFANQ